MSINIDSNGTFVSDAEVIDSKETIEAEIMENVISKGGGGTSNYLELANKPQINGVTLAGNKTSEDLFLLPTSHNNELTAHSIILEPISSAIGVIGTNISNVTEIIDNHVLDYANPHQTTADSVGAYTKEATDSKLAEKANTSLDNVPNVTFYTKGITSGLGASPVPEIQTTAELYIVGFNATNNVYILSTTSADYSFNWNVSTTQSTKTFRFVFTETGVISALSKYHFILECDSIEQNREYIFGASITANVGGQTRLIGGSTYTNQYSVNSPRIDIPIENNNLTSDLTRNSGDYVDFDITFQKDGGNSDTVVVVNNNLRRSKVVRNQTEVSSTNVVDSNGVNIKTQSQRNREYERLFGDIGSILDEINGEII